MRILSLESSCDESAAAFLEVEGGRIKRLEHLVASQVIHAQYGGVVPEVAAREHSATIPPLLAELAKQVVGESSGPKLAQQVDVVAVTRGPGLVTSLKVGFDTARSLALAWNKPFYGINHMEGHIYANWLPGGSLAECWDNDGDRFPAIVLVVSGGHTELLLMKGHAKFELLGATRDDAAGEAFDKAAKLLGLGYPGGPALSKQAERGNPQAFGFPRPLISSPNYDFSFAGLKTAVRYFLRDNQKKLNSARFVQDVAASVQEAIVDTLVTKTIRAAAKVKVRTVMLAGGVAANHVLRERLVEAIADKTEAELLVPPLKYCTDNAAMIAAAAYFNLARRRPDRPGRLGVDSNWELGR